MSGDRRTQPALEAVTGVHLMQGIGHQPSRGFWTEAWADVTRRPLALAALAWLGVVVFFAAFAPLVASGHPLVMRETTDAGVTTSSPLLAHLSAVDVLLALGLPVVVIGWLAPLGAPRSVRLRVLLFAGVQAGLSVLLATLIAGYFGARDASDAARRIEKSPLFEPIAVSVAVLVPAVVFGLLPFLTRGVHRAAAVGLVALGVGVVLWAKWTVPLSTFDYAARQARGEIEAVYTLIPFSPQQGGTSLDLKQPGRSPLAPVTDGLVEWAAKAKGGGGFADDPRFLRADRTAGAVSMEQTPFDEALLGALRDQLGFARSFLAASPDALGAEAERRRDAGELRTLADVVAWLEGLRAPRFGLGTDAIGQDVLSQMVHACRLSISVGLVSTSIAVLIGVTMGALMGYFGGWVDLVLYRIVEVFMSMPVLFLLIVAAAVLERQTHVMMIIIGCVSWTGAARFTRAEFLKLRDQDFVQSARAGGLPLSSVLFKHMLPNGVTPVLVDASFAIAAAILAEAVLSYLGLGPANQASWGKLLSAATNQVGSFVWWLAIFPGLAIFLTVLAYNLLGEALRDAIDPRRKKARV